MPDANRVRCLPSSCFTASASRADNLAIRWRPLGSLGTDRALNPSGLMPAALCGRNFLACLLIQAEWWWWQAGEGGNSRFDRANNINYTCRLIELNWSRHFDGRSCDPNRLWVAGGAEK